MKLSVMRDRVARNLKIKGSDGSIADGSFSPTDLNDVINDLYLEEIVPMLNDYFQDDFIEETYPQPTYTQTSTTTSVSTGNTLTVIDNIFDNYDEGLYIENGVTGQIVEIDQYLSSTQVTLKTEIDATWASVTVYLLGDTYLLQVGDSSDFREVADIRMKFKNTDTYYMPVQKIDEIATYQDRYYIGSKYDPKYSLTTVQVDKEMLPAIRFFPRPTSHTGSWVMKYTAKPVPMSDDDEPMLRSIGISQALIAGATAWGYGQLGDQVKHDMWWAQYLGMVGTIQTPGSIVQNYRPRTRSGATRFNENAYEDNYSYRDY